MKQKKKLKRKVVKLIKKFNKLVDKFDNLIIHEDELESLYCVRKKKKKHRKKNKGWAATHPFKLKKYYTCANHYQIYSGILPGE